MKSRFTIAGAAAASLFFLNSCNLFLHAVTNSYNRNVPLSRLPELEKQR